MASFIKRMLDSEASVSINAVGSLLSIVVGALATWQADLPPHATWLSAVIIGISLVPTVSGKVVREFVFSKTTFQSLQKTPASEVPTIVPKTTDGGSGVS